MRKKIQDEFVVNAQKIHRKTTKIGNFVDRSKYGSYNYFGAIGAALYAWKQASK